jgi:hypothetical protein
MQKAGLAPPASAFSEGAPPAKTPASADATDINWRPSSECSSQPRQRREPRAELAFLTNIVVSSEGS